MGSGALGGHTRVDALIARHMRDGLTVASAGVTPAVGVWLTCVVG